ncbi:hypothetical protein H632_c3461p0 [Helicosporidium sp. ATCC 50920]|nr:hypothetical protein H632_c3461p0 [Helicosporidium sp. ATCC 50920]|eukprot:KDD72357.1 hypothetical protein H632_c3461p0 [Helicosporidium sp. ATCC 50920]
MWDLSTQALLTRQAAEEVDLRALELHPDGLVLCTAGARGPLAVWETRSQKSVAALTGHAGPVNALAFSENGYHLASAGDDGVRVWDLRKQRQIALWEEFAGARAVQFDLSGLFLAMGGDRGVQVAGAKQAWGVLGQLPADALHKGAAAALAWGADAKTLYVGGGDHNLRVFQCAQ